MATQKSSDTSIHEEDDNLLGAKETLANEDVAITYSENSSELHKQIDLLSKSLKEAQEKADSNWERLLRKEAELQNVQKRAQQDLENARKSAIERFALEMLSVLDSLEQGIAHSQNNEAAKSVLEGITLTHASLLSALEKFDIAEINAQVGEVFNPSFHEAISVHETTDMEPNRIMAVVQKGYMLPNRLLRPARVVVSKAPQK